MSVKVALGVAHGLGLPFGSLPSYATCNVHDHLAGIDMEEEQKQVISVKYLSMLEGPSLSSINKTVACIWCLTFPHCFDAITFAV